MPTYANLPRNGLVLEVMLDGSAIDSSGNGASLTATSVSWANCPVGYQKYWGSFNGSSSWIDLGTFAFGGFANSFSAEFSIFTTGSGTYTIAGVGRTTEAWQFKIEDGLLKFLIRSISPALWVTVASVSFSQYASKSIRVGFSHDASAKRIDILVDGISVANGTYTQSPGNIGESSNIGSTIGCYSTSAWDKFNGNIGSASFFNRILSEFERLAYLHEFNRALAGGSDFGAVIPTPTAYFNAVGEDTFYDVQNGTKATRTAGAVATDNLGLSNAISTPNQSWTYVSGDSYVYWNNSGWKLEKNQAAVTATGVNTSNTVRAVLYFPASSLTATQETALGNLFALKYPATFRSSIPGVLENGSSYFFGIYDGTNLYANGKNKLTMAKTGTVNRAFVQQNRSWYASDSVSYFRSSVPFTVTSTGSYTIGGWIKADPLSNSPSYIQLSNADTGTATFGFRLSTDSNYWKANAIRFGTASQYINSNIIRNSNVFTHVFAVFDNGIGYIYIHGLLVGSASYSTNPGDGATGATVTGMVFHHNNLRGSLVVDNTAWDANKIMTHMYSTFVL